jgi:hypothetical protein
VRITALFVGVATAAIVAVPIVAVPIVAVPTAAVAAPDTNTAKTDLPYTLSIKGANGTAQTDAQIPQGTTPISLTGTITSTYTTPGTINISINGRSAASVDSRTGGPVNIPLSAGDITESGIQLGLSTRLESDKNCFAEDNAVASLVGTSVTYQLATSKDIATIGDFLSPGIPQYTVVVSPEASNAAQTAALNAVAALSHSYGPPTKVTLVSTDSPGPSGFLNRQVRIAEASITGDDASAEPTNEVTVTEAVLAISGNAAGLTNAAAALSNPDIGAITTNAASNINDEFIYQPVPLETTLAGLNAAPVRLEGIGTQTVELAVNQPSFGTSLESVEVRVSGAMTEVQPGGQGRVDYLWNDELVDSTPMGAASTIKNTLKIPAEQLRRTNSLGISLSYAPPGAECSPKPLGARADIDITTTAVFADSGDSLPAGFERFPQVFGSGVPITYLNNGPTATELVATANLVASLERNWPLQHVYSIVSPEEFSKSGGSGIAVGVPDEQSSSTVFTQAPLSSTTNATLLAGDGADLQVTSDTAYAYVQAYVSDSRNIIMLGTHAADNEAAALTARDELAAFINDNPNGWAALTNQVVTKLPGDPVQTLTIAQPAPNPSLVPYIVATIIALALLAVLVLAWLWRRPRGDAPTLPGDSAS